MPKIQKLAKDASKSITGVRFMTVSSADPNCLLMVGNNNAHFVTKDAGNTYELVNSVVQQSVVLFYEHLSIALQRQFFPVRSFVPPRGVRFRAAIVYIAGHIF